MMREIFDAFQASLFANLGDLGIVEKPSMGFGARALSENDAPPRVVWVPREGRHDKKQLTAGDRNQAVRMIWTRHVLIDLHIWAADETAAEELCNHIVATLEEGLGAGGYSMAGESWQASESTAAGIKMVLSFVLRMPWFKQLLPLTAAKSLKPIHTVRFITGIPWLDRPKGNVA